MSLPNEVIPIGLLGTGVTGEYQIERSLRFNSADSAYLSRTPASAGNRKTWTWAGWVKLAAFADSSPHVFGTDNDDANRSALYYTSTNQLGFYSRTSAVTDVNVTTSAVYRDYSAWYHIVLTVDTNQATPSNVTKIYVNGIEQALTVSAGVQNALTQVNNNVAHSIGRRFRFEDRYLDGYLADIHFIDGQALDPTSFGKFDTNGVWQPKEYAGTYGTNGFYLPFSDNSTAAALGTDTSGNGNDWTVNNISISEYSVSYTGSNSGLLNQATDGIFGNSTLTDTAYTATFDTSISYNSLLIVYGNMANGQLGNPASGAILYVNGSAVSATGTYGVSPYSTSYAKKYETNTPGTLTSLGISAAVSGSYQSGIFEVFVDGSLLVRGSPATDSFVDSPTNYGTDTGAGGEVVGNYATLNPLNSYSAGLSNGNLQLAQTTTSWVQGNSTIGVSSGKWYWEVTWSSGTNILNGITKSPLSSSYVGSTSDSWGYAAASVLYNSGSTSSYGSNLSVGDVIGVALDLDAGTLVFYNNGVSQGQAASGLSGTFFAAISVYGTTSENINFGQRPFDYTSPSGYKALCTANLPEPTIADGSTVMDVALYTGNGSTQTISGLGFIPDLVWIKARSTSGQHVWTDAVRGVDKQLFSSLTNAEQTSSTGLTAFTSDGFSLGSNPQPSGDMNTNGSTYAGWTWDAGSSTVTNTDGSITSSVRANPSAGFSIVTYTGNGTSGATVGHGLGAKPFFRIIKRRDATSTIGWMTFHESAPTSYFTLNSANAATPASEAAPTSTVFYLPSDANSNANGGTYVSYCFAPIEGYSAFGSYTGNGSADGSFVYTGFSPRWVMVKGSNVAGGQWFIVDASRSPYNVTANYIQAESSSAEGTTSALWDFCSNGFKLRGSGVGINGSGSTYIYAAFAENPFSLARAR